MAAENRPEEQKDQTKSSFFADLLDLAEVAITTFFVFMLLSFYLIRPVTVDGTSMVPTLHDRDKLVMLTLFPPVTNGHIVVINDREAGYFTDEAQTQVARRSGYEGILVKRVIATAGQQVNIDTEAGTVAVDGVQLAETYIADLTKREDGAFRYPFTVPEGYIFVMGDNRMRSTDSRNPAIGLVPKEQVLGTVLFRYNRESDQREKWTDRFDWLF
ncbi:MAG: signal peptidase I [Oscillospiraceae bacterium]|nr:signal peptidase I [Oscillospiraceae bacterium]